MKKYIHDLSVIQNRKVNNDHFILVLKCPVSLPQVLPGQFVEARIDHSPNTFLRRPLSVHDVDYDANTLSLLIQKKGEGTHMLSTLIEGDTLNIVYPLGNSFTLTTGTKALLVGGGCGIAPLLYLAKFLGNNGKKVSILMGGRTSAHIMESETYKSYGELLITTEDGSLGKKGFVIHHPVWWEGKFDFDVIYTCGPDPMMKAVAKLAAKHGVPCQVSLEQTMACGIGACLCCVVETTNGHKCTCTEGPVFDYKELKGWKPE
jgi:dihydroorotate dehydrogenase electron transfer subunit